MHRVDMEAITRYGLRGELLMENAGQAVYSVISRELGTRNRRFVVLSGPGNNGGDGFVVARKLHAAGGEVRVLVMARAGSYSGPALKNLRRLEKAGIDMVFKPNRDEIPSALAWCDATVDGLLGTGVKGDLTKAFRNAVEEVNRAGKPVFSIDIPSGVDGNTGLVHGVSIRAMATITFGLPKRGNILQPGRSLGGRLVLSPISFPRRLQENACRGVALNVPPRLTASGIERGDRSRSRVFFVVADGGAELQRASADEVAPSATMTFASLRHCPASATACSTMASTPPGPSVEAASDISESGGEARDQDPLALLSALSGPMPLAVVGDAEGLSREFFQLAHHLVTSDRTPVLLAGPFLGLLSPGAPEIRSRTMPSVLVLDRKDLTRLTGMEESKIERDVLPLARDWGRVLGSMVVLRDPTFIIAMPDGRVFLNPGRDGQEELRGEEELLMGTIAALYDLGASLEESVRGGVSIISASRGRPSSSQPGYSKPRAVLEQLSDTAALLLHDHPAFVDRFAASVEVI